MKKELEKRISELKKIINYEYESIQIRIVCEEKLKRLEQLYSDLFENF